jgi:hypothetical protein
MTAFRIQKEKHEEHPWTVQRLAKDFIIEDVWEYPIRFNESEGDSLYAFRKKAVEPMIKSLLKSQTISGTLFRIRKIFGDVFGIDKQVNKLPVPKCAEISLFDRMSAEEKQKNNTSLSIDIESDNYLSFRSVYAFPNETLDELSNLTEHSLMHYAWVKNADDTCKVQMAVYVKHRNVAGKVYMDLIRPFRHHIVYPFLFGEAINMWEQYKINFKRHKTF